VPQLLATAVEVLGRVYLTGAWCWWLASCLLLLASRAWCWIVRAAECRDLLEKLLNKDYTARIKLNDIKSHAWMSMVCLLLLVFFQSLRCLRGRHAVCRVSSSS
jgi:hypothetical protein